MLEFIDQMHYERELENVQKMSDFRAVDLDASRDKHEDLKKLLHAALDEKKVLQRQLKDTQCGLSHEQNARDELMTACTVELQNRPNVFTSEQVDGFKDQWTSELTEIAKTSKTKLLAQEKSAVLALQAAQARWKEESAAAQVKHCEMEAELVDLRNQINLEQQIEPKKFLSTLGDEVARLSTKNLKVTQKLHSLDAVMVVR